LPDIPQIDDLSLRDHLVAQHAPRPGWREEFSLDASNVFVFGNRPANATRRTSTCQSLS